MSDLHTPADRILRSNLLAKTALILLGSLAIFTLSISLFRVDDDFKAAHAEENLFTIRGVVTSQQGGGVGSALVKILSTGESTQTEDSGRFVLKTQKKGKLVLQVTATGFVTQQKSIDVTGAFTDVLFTLEGLKTKNRPRVQMEAESAPSEERKSRVAVARAPKANDTLSFGDLSTAKSGLSGRGSGYGGGGKLGARRSRPAKRSPSRPMADLSPASPMKQMIAATSLDSDRESAARDGYKKIDENDFKDPQADPLSTFSIDVDTASYSNLRRFIQNGQRPPIDAVKIEEMINYFDYNYDGPSQSDAHPFSVKTELAEAPWNPKHKLMHIGLQGRKIEADQLPPSNLVFLLDVSGSMSGPDRLPLLKQALMLLSGTLRAQDKVSIVVYAGSAGLVLPPTPGSQRRKIIEAFSKLTAGGSTAGGAGIKLAYKIAQDEFIKGGNNRVILATDGDFNVGTRSQSELVRLIEKKRKSGVFLTVLGFGRGNYQASTMSDLAEKGNGNHAYIDSILEAQKVLVSEMGGTLHTIAKDVKIQVEFNPALVGRYRLIGYQSRILAAADFNNDKKDAGELGAGHSVTALYEIIPPDEVKSSEGSVDPLKYQQKSSNPSTQPSDEWLTVKLRYKKPDGEKSVLMTHPHKGDRGDWREASEDFRFSAGVAAFGMLLRDSKYFGTRDTKTKWNQVEDILKGSMGKDSQGYRSELMDLVKRARKRAESQR